MKIPETSANVGAYYGNEENGQWQPNGVIIDSGVGGGVVGSGDAGIHRPPVYPLHLPRGHMPAGYVMAGAYYPPAAYPPVPAPPQDDFADYMWMENEEEFDKQVMQQLEEEALMEQCIEAMLEDEQRERQHRPTANGHNHHYPTTSNGAPSLSLEETVSRSTLNPLAAEFVPTGARPAKEERQDTPEAPATEEPSQKTEETPSEQTTTSETVEDEQTKTEEPVPPQKDPPEVSAADVQPIDKTQRPASREAKKEPVKAKVEPKKAAKTELKPKVKPVAVKSETKVQPKKKEVKSIKSETKTEECKPAEEPAEVTKVSPQAAPTPSLPEEPAPPSGFKPINYAAAAKANKPKKPSITPTIEKQQPPQPVKIEKVKTEKIEKKDKLKTDKPPLKTDKVNVQRKNSTK